MIRAFAFVSAYAAAGLTLPQRQTTYSAGYDLAAAATTTCSPGQVTLIPTGVKVYLPPDEFLMVSLRSSIPRRYSLLQANPPGIIDADYVDNPENEGLIMVQVVNIGSQEVIIPQGERIAQGVFLKFLTCEGEQPPTESRRGGHGSTGK